MAVGVKVPTLVSAMPTFHLLQGKVVVRLCVSEKSSCCAVNSVLAIGGVGGLAVGLAGREILENLFTGLIILSSSPFEVGDEVLFSPPSGQVSSFCLLIVS